MTGTRLLTLLLGLVLLGATTAACGDGAAPAVGEPTTAVEQGLDVETLASMDVVEMIDMLEAMPVAERPDDVLVSVRSDEVVLADDSGEEAVVAAPDGLFHLSVAPYVDHTHDCYFHSLTTCTGEMGGAAVDVTVVDTATGEVLIEETTRTHDNGYVAYWLPDDIQAEVTIASDGRTGTAVVTTGVDDLTCLTTLQLT